MPSCSALCWLSVTSASTHKQIGCFWADSQVGRFIYVLGPSRSLSHKLSCEPGSCTHCPNPHNIFHSEVLKLYFPALEPWVTWTLSLPSCSSRFIHMRMWDQLGWGLGGTSHRPAQSTSGHLGLAAHLCPSYRSMFLL